MSDHVITLIPKKSRKEDIDDIEQDLESCSPFSAELCHLNTLLCMTVQSENTNYEDKRRCVQLVLKHSSTLQTLLKHAPAETIEFLQGDPINKRWRNIG